MEVDGLVSSPKRGQERIATIRARLWVLHLNYPRVQSESPQLLFNQPNASPILPARGILSGDADELARELGHLGPQGGKAPGYCVSYLSHIPLSNTKDASRISCACEGRGRENGGSAPGFPLPADATALL